MIRETLRALAGCLLTFVLCAVAYPAATWGLGQMLFPDQAEGSLIRDRDRSVIGSSLIAQPFVGPRYFHPRPSAVDYKADAAGGSNLATTNPDQRKKIAERAEALGASAEKPVPADLVMASGGGLDPHISVEAARFQVESIARARGLDVTTVRNLLDGAIDRSGSFLGAPPRVNVLELNLTLIENFQASPVGPESGSLRDSEETIKASNAGRR